jgi:hypothetical protein
MPIYPEDGDCSVGCIIGKPSTADETYLQKSEIDMLLIC